MRIILLGPPGAGKGTQAKTLAKRLNLVHISTGDLLRQNALEGTRLGKQAKDFMNKGALVPDELVTWMLAQKVTELNDKNGFILDGYPRNINQAKALDDILSKLNCPINLVIYLDASTPVIIQRLTGRLVCKSCGANFHIKNMPPKINGICDNCGGKLYQRADDNAETIKKRLQVYKEEADSLIGYYESKQKLYRVSADEETELVINKILHLTEEHNDSLKV